MKKRTNFIMRKLLALAICCSALLTVGCAAQKYGAANIVSEPAGAEIINLKDETNLGRTPAKVVWRGEAGSSEQVTVQLRKGGYKYAIATLWVNKRHDTEEEAKNEATDVFTELVKE
jgi:hypothetical protein